MNPPTLANLSVNTRIPVTQENLQRANLRANKRRTGIDHHWRTEFVTVEEIPDSATGDTEKCTTGDTIEETTDDHGLNILCHCTGNQPNEEESEGDDIDVSPAIELIKLAVIEYWNGNEPPIEGPGKEDQPLFMSASDRLTKPIQRAYQDPR